MKFEKTYLKLTIFYVLIIMLISLFFSVTLYRISSNEINRGLGRQNRVLRDIPMHGFENTPMGFLEELEQEQLEESGNRLKLNLIYFNLLILSISTILSYLLAKKTLKPIKESMDAQSRFTADASHELRTPLTAMKTEIEVALKDKKLNEADTKKLLKSNLEELEKLESLSGALLKLAKTEETTRKDFQRISLEEVIVESYEKVEKIAETKSIKFKNKLKNYEVLGDKDYLKELFSILLENAIKYSSANSTISITIEKDKKQSIVRIKDSGMGIKASQIPHIFERFYRADTSRNKEKTPGYGLGLAIAKQIIDLHKGTISVSSRLGKGTEFVVKL